MNGKAVILLLSVILVTLPITGCNNKANDNETLTTKTVTETESTKILSTVSSTITQPVSTKTAETSRVTTTSSTTTSPTAPVTSKTTTTSTSIITTETTTTITTTTKPIEEPVDLSGVDIIATDPWYQGTVDAIKALQPKDIPKHLTEDSGNKTGAEFNMNDYFTVLTHLSMKDGYVLDYVYMYDWSFGGRPIIYVRKESQEPYKNFEEYYKYMESITPVKDDFDFVTLVMSGNSGALENKVVIDGTKQGFFEYIVLQMLGGQFYLAWHAGYDDARIICDPYKINDVVKEIQDWDVQPIPPDILRKAWALDYEPKIVFSESTVDITLYYFTKWGGFIKITFTVNLDYPHKIINAQNDQILEYECGMMF
jgi:hypothetical protein